MGKRYGAALTRAGQLEQRRVHALNVLQRRRLGRQRHTWLEKGNHGLRPRARHSQPNLVHRRVLNGRHAPRHNRRPRFPQELLAESGLLENQFELLSRVR